MGIKGTKLTEKELLMLLKQKNEEAFNYCYDHYAPLLYGVILREVGNERIASGILKSTFIKIFNSCKNPDCVKISLFASLLAGSKETAVREFKVNIDFKSLPPRRSTNTDNTLANTNDTQADARKSSSYSIPLPTIT